MARGKKGRPVSGWVIVDKPAGIGSTDVVGKVRWAAGHLAFSLLGDRTWHDLVD